MPSVLIADDHVIVRRGLRGLLAERFRPSEVEEVTTCAALLACLAQRPFTLLILDLQLADGNALDVLERIARSYPRLRVLIHSMGAEKLYAQHARELGAWGFISKQADEEEMLLAISTLLRGQRYLSHEQRISQMRRSSKAGGLVRLEDLSPRELSVMRGLLEGRGVKEMAEQMGLQPSTVATYKARLFDKLNVGGLVELQRWVNLHGPLP